MGGLRWRSMVLLQEPELQRLGMRYPGAWRDVLFLRAHYFRPPAMLPLNNSPSSEVSKIPAQPYQIAMAFTVLSLLLLAIPVLTQIPQPAAQCPGYRATNVLRGNSYLVADLVLIGNCSSHSKDVENLRLLVEYQTGKADHPP